MGDASSNGRRAQSRDVAHERAFSAAAAALIERSPVPLTRLAEQRAPDTPIRDFSFRDLDQDALEELADCRNYIAWSALRHDIAHRGDPHAQIARAALQRALAHVTEAFAEVNLARSVFSGLPTSQENA